ncbi:hypothetical protein [Polyangium sp. 6x1]|uniref:hypothetical protein n=1 Tax=Polyangium sp. 6x1 TaxID=3042689 RepID=UPI002482E27D|nr:hypothetical protein [Polyangium sp. 6x1]MDI1444217.1 hypothetical protein [Polyangium sp. 6x1]
MATTPDELLAWPWHQLVIPWRDEHGRITTIQRRDIRRDEARGDRPKYVGTRGRPPGAPYGVVDRLAGPPRPLLYVEGAVDVLAARVLARGPVDVLGIPGVGTWEEKLAVYGEGRRVLVGFDRDEAKRPGELPAGEATARLAAVALSARGASVERVLPPRGAKDWGAALEAQLAKRRR